MEPENLTTAWTWQFISVLQQQNVSDRLSLLVISQERSFRTEIHSVLAKRHFNFVKKNHAREQPGLFPPLLFLQRAYLGFHGKMWVCQERKLQQETMLKTYTLLFKKWEKHGKILHSNCFNVSFKCRRLTDVKGSPLANSHIHCYQISHLKSSRCEA